MEIRGTTEIDRMQLQMMKHELARRLGRIARKNRQHSVVRVDFADRHRIFARKIFVGAMKYRLLALLMRRNVDLQSV